MYEGVASTLPDVRIGETSAIVLQTAVFEIAVFVFTWAHDLRTATVAGTAATVVVVTGSVVMLCMGERTHTARAPASYRRLPSESSIKVVLDVFAFVAPATHLFVFDPR